MLTECDRLNRTENPDNHNDTPERKLLFTLRGEARGDGGGKPPPSSLHPHPLALPFPHSSLPSLPFFALSAHCVLSFRELKGRHVRVHSSNLSANVSRPSNNGKVYPMSRMPHLHFNVGRKVNEEKKEAGDKDIRLSSAAVAPQPFLGHASIFYKGRCVRVIRGLRRRSPGALHFRRFPLPNTSLRSLNTHPVGCFQNLNGMPLQ